MAEVLQLVHTVGRAGWDVSHAGGSAEFALAAVGRCFARRRLLFNLPLVWRLRKLWHEGVAQLDPRALRLALGVDRRVRVSGARIDVALSAPADPAQAGGPPVPALAVSLPLAAVRGADERLPALDDGLDWRVHALSADGVRAFRRLARALERMSKGTRVELRACARESRSPAALRKGFPLRIDLLLHPDDGYLTLVPARTIELAD
jgi:hypothetical protein